MERTGHYQRPLQQYLQELDIVVYVMHVPTKQVGLLKTDKRDALTLANTLYSQLELGVQVPNKVQLVRRVVPPTEAAAQLKGLIRHRYELIRESTQRKNKLTSICDELFPELVQVLKDPNGTVALTIRERFPTPQILAVASLTSLQEIRGEARILTDAKLVELQRLACQSIGVKEVARQRGLLLEQGQLIKELQLLHTHVEQLDHEIRQIIEHAREGQILLSFPGVGPIAAATIIAAIGLIHNFPSTSALKSYFGWAPVVAQSGSSLDHASLTRGGTRTMKQMLFLVVMQTIRQGNNEWAKLYERLVKHAAPMTNERSPTPARRASLAGLLGR